MSKGSQQRPTNLKRFRANYDRVFGQRSGSNAGVRGGEAFFKLENTGNRYGVVRAYENASESK